MVSEPLGQVLSERQDVRLLLVWLRRSAGAPPAVSWGSDRAPAVSGLARLSVRARHLPGLLAPLATLNDFADAKSALKYLEAAAVGVPTIASPPNPSGMRFETVTPVSWRRLTSSGRNGSTTRSIATGRA